MERIYKPRTFPLINITLDRSFQKPSPINRLTNKSEMIRSAFLFFVGLAALAGVNAAPSSLDLELKTAVTELQRLRLLNASGT